MTARLRDIERLHLGLLAGVVCAVWLTGWLSAPSVLLGGAVMGVNFWLMRQLAARLLVPARVEQPGLVMLFMVAKFALFVGLLALLFWRVPVGGVSFAAGATLLLVASVLTTLRVPQPAHP